MTFEELLIIKEREMLLSFKSMLQGVGESTDFKSALEKVHIFVLRRLHEIDQENGKAH